MKRFLFFVTALSLVSFVLSGCGKDDDIKTISRQASDSNTSRPNPANNPDTLATPSENDSTTVQGPIGTADDPFLISTTADWHHWMTLYASDSSKYFQLTAPIMVSRPIDTFCGILDGNGQVITISSHPVFKVVSGAIVKDLTVAGNVNVLTEDDLVSQWNLAGVYERYFGCIACKAVNDALLENCISQVSIKLSSDYRCYASPICGWLSHGVIDHCIVQGQVHLASGRLGGMSVSVDTGSIIRNSYYLGDLVGDDVEIGGIAFVANGGTIENCFYYGSITGRGSASAAGIAIRSKGGIIDNCYYYGSISASAQAGICYAASSNGIVRYCYGTVEGGIRLVSNTNGGIVESCVALQNDHQLEMPGPYGSSELIDELNSRVSQLDGARNWAMRDGIVSIR
ncbi:MAG: hypothetical protein IJ764_04230 [Bacteroidales bacterium]|nr:hypothetical protein [Bacteroidales bacterium]